MGGGGKGEGKDSLHFWLKPLGLGNSDELCMCKFYEPQKSCFCFYNYHQSSHFHDLYVLIIYVHFLVIESPLGL